MHPAVHADNQIEIFSDSVSAKATDLHDQVPLKDSECSGNDGKHVEACPGFTAHKEGPQVFDDLHDFNSTLGETDLLDLIVNNARAVQNTDDAAHRHHASGIGKDARHDADKRFFFEN